MWQKSDACVSLWLLSGDNPPAKGSVVQRAVEGSDTTESENESLLIIGTTEVPGFGVPLP